MKKPTGTGERSAIDSSHPVVLVTGGTSGIGLATARLLAQRGFTVVAVGRHTDGLEAAGPDGASAQGSLTFRHMDVTVSDQIADVISALPRLDAVVHCAGFGIAGSAERTPIEAVRRQFEVNYFGVLRVNGLALPLMRRTAARTHRPGHVVVVGSIAGRIGIPFQSHYSSTKAALEVYVEALRLEGRRHGVTATIVEPGDLATGFTKAREVDEPADSPYAAELRRSVGQMEHDELSGAGPETVATVVAHVIASPRPPVRVAVGASYKALMQLKRVMPDRLVEAIMRRLYM